MEKLTMKKVLTKEAYTGLTSTERRAILKYEQAKEYSGLRKHQDTCKAVFEQIPSEWFDKYSAKHIGEIAALLKIAYDNGKNSLDKI